MPSEVGSGQVAIYPTFKGFRRAVNSELDGAAKTASTGFSRLFGRTGVKSGTDLGKGVKTAFASATSNLGQSSLKSLSAEVAAASRAVSTARLKQQDVTGRLRVAEAALTEAQSKYTVGSSKLIAAEERHATAQRAVQAAQDTTRAASDRLSTAQGRLKDVTAQVGTETETTSKGFRRFGTTGVRAFNSLGSAAGGLRRIVETGLGFVAGQLAIAGFTRATAALVGSIRDSITKASDLQQSIGGVDAVFKGSAARIHQWAIGAAQSVGLSQDAYNKFAAVIGSQLKGAGVPMDELAGKTNQLITLGSDLAATYGGTTADAVESLGAALRGEFDPIEKFGVSLNQAAINARGTKLGFDLVSGSLSTQGKQAATLSLIYDRTRDAQGQFAKQTSTLAEQQQILAAQTDNLKAKFGTALLPVISAVVGALSNAMTPALAALQPAFDRIGAGAQALAPKLSTAFAGFATQIGPAISNAVAIGSSIISSLGPALTQYATSLGGLLKSIGPDLASAASGIGPALSQIIPQLATAAKSILPAVLDVVKALLPLLPPIASAIAAIAPVLAFLITNALVPLIQMSSSTVQSFLALANGASITSIAMQALAGKFGPITQGAAQLGVGIGTAIRSVRLTLAGGVAAVVSFASQVVRTAVGIVAPFTAPVRAAVQTAITTFRRVAQIIAPLRADLNQIVSGATTLLGRFVAVVTSAVSRAVSSFTSRIRQIVAPAQGAFSNVTSAASSGMSRVTAAVSAGVNRVVSVVGSIIGRVRGAVSGFGSALYGAGAALIQGLINGVLSRLQAAVSAVHGVLSAVARLLPHSPALEGPFSGRGWTLYSGQAIGSALASGIDQSRPSVLASANRLMQAASVAGGPAVSRSVAGVSGGGSSGKNVYVTYNAAPNVSINAKADFLAAMRRLPAFGVDV